MRTPIQPKESRAETQRRGENPFLIFPLRTSTSLRAILLLMAVSMLTGCADAIKTVMVVAPNVAVHDTPGPEDDPSPGRLKMLGIDRQERIAVGPPNASILTWIIEPRPRKADGSIDQDAAPIKPRGTVFVLHGYRLSMYWLRGFGRDIAAGGYRAVMMDLRGHGHSTGQWITFGVSESRDLSQVIDALKQRGVVEGPIGLWGISLGAVTCLKTASGREDVAAVVAVAPFTRLREVAPGMIELATAGVGNIYSDEHLQRMITEAAAEAGFDPEQAECVESVKKLKAPLLLIHGRNDWVAPPAQGRAVYSAAASKNKKHLELSVGHMGAHFDPDDLIGTESVRWYDRFCVKNSAAAAPR